MESLVWPANSVDVLLGLPQNEHSHSSYLDKLHLKIAATQSYIDENLPQLDGLSEDHLGILYLLITQAFNAIMITTCKLLEMDKLFEKPIHPLQILFVRMVVTYACCVAYMYAKDSTPDAPFGPKEMRPLLVLRGAVGFFGVFGLYYSLMYLSLSDAVALTFLVPMVTAFLAHVLLKERYSVFEGACSLFSLVGVLLIAKPSSIFGTTSSKDDAIESSSTEKRLIATGFGLFGVLASSMVYIILRKIGMNAHPLITVSYHSLVTTVMSGLGLIAIPSLSFVLPKTAKQIFYFALIGIFGFAMQIALAAGVQRVKASKAALISYTNMIFSLTCDLVVFGHLPGWLSMVGIAIILVNAFLVVKYKPEDTTYTSIPLDEFDIDDDSYIEI